MNNEIQQIKSHSYSLETGLKFSRELEHLINRYSIENGSDTPDFILCKYLIDCLHAYEQAIVLRNKWFQSGFKDKVEECKKKESF
jgi:hypothetical protein